MHRGLRTTVDILRVVRRSLLIQWPNKCHYNIMQKPCTIIQKIQPGSCRRTQNNFMSVLRQYYYVIFCYLASLIPLALHLPTRNMQYLSCARVRVLSSAAAYADLGVSEGIFTSESNNRGYVIMILLLFNNYRGTQIV